MQESAVSQSATPGVFRRSTYCANATCVEVAMANRIHIRDGKNPGGSVLSFGTAHWRAFVAGIKEGDFDRA